MPLTTAVSRDWLYDEAWWAGFFDGLADDYDCRPFPEFSLFTAYSKGRDAGLQEQCRYVNDDGPFQPIQLALLGSNGDAVILFEREEHCPEP